jgi:DNA-binding NarL/FixJ family response regulator
MGYSFSETGEGSLRRIPVVVPDGICDWQMLEKELPPQDGFVLVRPGGGLQSAFPYCQALEPCVLLADPLGLQDQKASGFQQAVQAQRIRVLVVIREEETDTIQQLLLSGAMGFVARDNIDTELRRAIRSVWRGEIWASRLALSTAFRTCLPSLDNRLTNRERQLMRLLEEGLTNREVAGHMGISRETVRWHARRLYSKVGSVNRQGVNRRSQGHEAPAVARDGTNG